MVHASSANDEYRLGYETVVKSMNAYGGLQSFEQAGGVTIESSGAFDLTVRIQGRSPFQPEPTPIRKKFSVDLVGDRLAYEVDWSNLKFSR